MKVFTYEDQVRERLPGWAFVNVVILAHDKAQALDKLIGYLMNDQPLANLSSEEWLASINLDYLVEANHHSCDVYPI